MRSVPSLFALRRDFRAGRMIAVLDATSYANLAGLLAETGLPHQSLFFGEDAEFLQGEAPYAVTLDPENRAGVKRLIAGALYRHAGFITLTDAGQDDIRRHFKSWLTVNLGEEEGLAMFRFYDTRILLAFIATLGASEARAFFGPAETLLVAGQGGVDALDRPGLPGPARIGLPKGHIHQINDAQMEAMTRVTDEVFRARLAEYLRTVWFAEGADAMTAEERATLVDAAIGDCARLGSCTEQDVVLLAVFRLLAAPLAEDDGFWDHVARQRPEPHERANVVIAQIVAGMEDEPRAEFFAKLNFWSDFPTTAQP